MGRTWRKLGLAAIAVLAAGAAGIYHGWRAPAPTELTLYGNVDIRQVDLAFNSAGRLSELRKEEGDPVKAGEVLARIEPETYQDLVALATARLEAQRALVEKLVAGSRPEEIERDKAQVEADRATVVDAQLVFDRRSQLVKTGATTIQSVDDARAALDTARAHLGVSEKVLALTVLGPRQEDIDQAKAQLRSDEAALSLAKRRLEDAVLTAPSDGIVLSRIHEVGAIVGPTSPIYTVTLTDKIWVRSYVPEPDLGRVKPGLAVSVTSDTSADHAYEGWVGFISPTAEFTPKTVETPELRTQLVYRLRIFIKTPD
ncbi:MAG: HlyD family efflux transporter periplasmic adaptor subunit, partial [Acidobacteriota bacterium]